MALRVWLPLDGNLKNNGLSNISVSNTSAVVNNNGKIGQCYSFGTASSYISLSKEAMTSFTTEASVSFWLNILTWNTSYATFFQAGLASSPWASYTFGFLRNASNSICCFTISNGSSNTSNTCLTPALSLNTWYHICLCYKTGYQYIYLNGELVTTKTVSIVPNFAGITTITLGKCNDKSSYQTNCLMNDFRIYDHCLSPKEIKEISKGLLLHYKLDDVINTNLFLSTPKAYTPTNYNAYQLQMTENLQAGQTYTMQLWDVYVSHSGKTADKLGLSVYWGGGSVALKTCNGAGYFTNGYADYISFSFTVTSSQASGSGATNSWLNIYNSVPSVSGTLYMHIGAWKLEKGSVETDIFGNNAIINDVSGYEHNGSLLGELNISNDSSRYNCSTLFNGDTSGILIENLNISNVINTALTYSFWIKPAGENGARSVYFGSYSGSSFSIEKTTANKLRLYWNGSPDLTSTLTITDGQWQHIVITKNGTTEIKVYLNGVLTQTLTNTYNNVSFPTTYRIGRDTRTGATSYKGLMSDFRIYSTVLSNKDVLELYNNPANIDYKGNMFSYKFDENAKIDYDSDEKDGLKQQIMKNGIVNIDNLVEFSNRIKTLNDGSVFIQILHHNNPAANLFTADNCWFYNDNSNLYSALIMLKNCNWIRNLTEFEFLACEKLESSSTENQFRWKQTSNPALSSTITGRTIISGSPSHSEGLLNKGTYGCMHNGATYWCCCGSYTPYQGGTPGFWGVVKSGYIDLYIRIPDDIIKGDFDTFVKFYQKSILAKQLIEK